MVVPTRPDVTFIRTLPVLLYNPTHALFTL